MYTDIDVEERVKRTQEMLERGNFTPPEDARVLYQQSFYASPTYAMLEHFIHQNPLLGFFEINVLERENERNDINTLLLVLYKKITDQMKAEKGKVSPSSGCC